MDSARIGYDYIQIHKDRLGIDPSIILNEQQWMQVAHALADDLALTIKRLDSANQAIGALLAENASLRDNKALCDRDKCGYINEYKEMLRSKNNRIEALEYLLKDIGDMTIEEITNAVHNTKRIIG